MPSLSHTGNPRGDTDPPKPGAAAWVVIAAVIAVVAVMCAALAWPSEAGAAKRPPARACWVVVADVQALDTGAYRASVNGATRIVTPRSTRHPWLQEGRYTCAGFRARYKVLS